MQKKKFYLGGLILALTTFLCSPFLTSCAYEDKIAIGLECNYAPFNWTTKNESEHTIKISNKYKQYADGYDIEIAKRIGEELNKEVIIIKTAWESLIPDLQTRGLDLVIAGMTATEERRKSIDFTDEYYRSELVLITKKDIADKYKDKILTSNELEDLIKNKNIVSQSFTVTDDVIDVFKEKYHSLHAKPADSFANAALDVKSGSAFAMTSELPVAISITNANKNLGIVRIHQEILGELRGELGVSIGVRKGNTELKEAVNNVLKGISIEERTSIMLESVTRNTSY